MRRGINPVVALSKSGKIAGVALGSDSVNEHERGIGDLLKKFCSKFVPSDYLKEEYRKTGVMPALDIRSSHTLDQRLNSIQALDVPGHFMVSTHHNEYSSFLRPEIDHMSVTSTNEYIRSQVKKYHNTVCSEWDDANFRFMNAVHGEDKLIKKLRDFYFQLQAGTCAFYSVHCGLFPPGGTLATGLVIVDLAQLSYAQQNYWRVMESQLRDEILIYSKCHLDRVFATIGEQAPVIGHTSIGYFWGVWTDSRKKEEVQYGFNPGWNINADYYGPYSEEQLVCWLKSKKSYRLRKDSPTTLAKELT